MTQRTPVFPSAGAAFWIALLGWLSSLVVTSIVAQLSGASSGLAVALGLVVGFGGVGTLAARQVPPPAAERLGLRGLPLRFLLPLVLLLPVSLLASEVDNVVKGLVPDGSGSNIADQVQKLASAGGLEMLETAIVGIGIQPVLSEWFYRGVLQQGVVAQLGPRSGILLVALLCAVAQGAPGPPLSLWLGAASSEFVSSLAYGILRHTSGSLLGPILLRIAINACGGLALGFASQMPIAGFNTPDPHTPVVWLLPAAASVALGVVLALRFGRGGAAGLRGTSGSKPSGGPPAVSPPH